MRALLVCDGGDKLEALADGVIRGLEESGFRAELRNAEQTSGPIPTGAYDLIVIGSTVSGLIKPRLTDTITDAIGRFVRLEGKQIAAFIKERPIVGTKGMRTLMEAIERQGGFPRDFATLRDVRDATAFGRRLRTLVN